MVVLDDLEILGLRIVCANRCGLLEALSCITCGDSLQEMLNHDGNEQEEVVFSSEELGEFTACPLVLIPQSVHEFIDEYDYNEKYVGSAPSYGTCSAKYWQAVKIYESTMAEFRQPPKANKTSDNLSKMRSLMK